MMVKEFEDACFNGVVGVVQKPVKTNYGYHIIKVTDRSNKNTLLKELLTRLNNLQQVEIKILLMQMVLLLMQRKMDLIQNQN